MPVQVILATYTANLAAFFSRPAFELHGPASMSELKQSGVACGVPTSCHPHFARFASSVYVPQAGSPVGSTQVGTVGTAGCETGLAGAGHASLESDVQAARCLDALVHGKANVMVGPFETLNMWARTRCDAVGWANSISFGGVEFVMYGVRRAGNQTRAAMEPARVMSYMSAAVTHMNTIPAGAQQLEVASFGEGVACSSEAQNELPTITFHVRGRAPPLDPIRAHGGAQLARKWRAAGAQLAHRRRLRALCSVCSSVC